MSITASRVLMARNESVLNEEMAELSALGYAPQGGLIFREDGKVGVLMVAGESPQQTVYTESGALEVRSHTAILQPGATAMSLRAPTVAENGTRITLIANSDVQHVITTPADALLGTTSAGFLASGNTLSTIAHAPARWRTVLEAFEGAWLVDGLTTYGYHQLSTV